MIKMKCNRKKLYKQRLIIVLSIMLLSIVQVASADQVVVNTNRNIVLDDPNTGTAGSGFSISPSNWGTNYWSGASTTIRALAVITNNTGSPKQGVTVSFRLINPGGIAVNTASNITSVDGIAYYSYDLNAKNYWGYWKIEANITGAVNNTPFVLNWWGCASCHNNQNPSTWGTYAQKSYYEMGYNFHKSSTRNQHTSQMSTGNCIKCHQSYNITTDWHTGKVVCAGCHAGSNISTTPQGKNPEIAGCYDTAGCHPKKNSNLKNINSTTGYIVGGNYKTKYSAIPTNSTKAHTTSVECIACHGPGHNIEKPYNASVSSNSVTENEQCWACHTNRATTHKLSTNCVGCHSQDAHNVSVSAAGGGGPDCISCHNVVGGSTTHKVDVSAMVLGEHASLNSGAATTVDPANKKCWGCHQTGGTQPASGSMGDRYLNPYKCYDCHNTTKAYANVSGALTVSEHFKSGTDIQAAISATDNSTSCLVCHNLSEMKVSYTDNEFTNYSLASHYGKNRSELRIGGSTDCTYCHQNGSTIFMSNVNNNNMSNHSSSINTPTCTNSTCHNIGKVHDSSLSKPADSSDTYCKTCHTVKSEHKALYCTECHANNTPSNMAGRDIHGIKYLQKDNTFSQVRSGSVDCTTCHQSNVVDSSLGTFTAEKIGLLHHSNNLTNGSRWDGYWTSTIGACLYCHNDTKHSATPLGRPLIWNSSYIMRTTIGSGTNCADCHYGGDSNYAGMRSAFAGLNIPPEITNGSWNGKPGYYNHTLGDYTDQTCKSCHGSGTTVGEIMHNVSEGGAGGGGGADCKSCHNIGGIAPKLINFNLMNQNDASHKNLNSGASSTVNVENKKCWACHGDGTQPSSHPSNYKSPLDCTNCHTGTGSFNGPLVVEHNQIGQDVITAVNCTQCHINPGMFLGSGGTVQQTIHYTKYVTNKLTTPYGHNGTMDTSNCIVCHNGPYTGDQLWGTPVNISTSTKRIHTETTTAQCDNCHKDGSISTLANVDFHNAAIKLGAGQGPNCLDCHSSVQ